MTRSYTFAELRPEYAAKWQAMRLSDSILSVIEKDAKRILPSLPIYRSVEAITKVPAALLAAIHNRESNRNFKTYLGNGEPLFRVTTLVPKGRGPFKSWADGAIDALTLEGFHRARWHPWTVEMAAFAAETYNGFGYRQYHNEASPYLWAGSNQEEWGKYTADGKWNRSVWDSQIGVMPYLAILFATDPLLTLPRAS